MERPSTIKAGPALEYIEYLEKKLLIYEKSPHAKTYLTILGQINSFDEQLTLKEEKTVELVETGEKIKVQEGRIDIFGSKDDKEFDRAWKYMIDAYLLHEQLDKFRAKMSPEDKKAADEIQKTQNLGIAEKLAVKHNGGN